MLTAPAPHGPACATFMVGRSGPRRDNAATTASPWRSVVTHAFAQQQLRRRPSAGHPAHRRAEGAGIRRVDHPGRRRGPHHGSNPPRPHRPTLGQARARDHRSPHRRPRLRAEPRLVGGACRHECPTRARRVDAHRDRGPDGRPRSAVRIRRGRALRPGLGRADGGRGLDHPLRRLPPILAASVLLAIGSPASTCAQPGDSRAPGHRGGSRRSCS